MNKYTLLFIPALFAGRAMAQDKKPDPANDPKATEVWEPVPKIVTPGKLPQDAPSDAIILFNGRNLDAWHSVKDPSKPAAWTIDDGFFTVKKGTGNIETNKKFTDYQLHLEWKIPENISGEGQARGNSGVFLASTGGGDDGYEIQILDVYNNKTYVNGQTGSVYKQAVPLANANKKPGEWQYYDIIWNAPRFNEDGTVQKPASVTLFLNGVLLQNGFVLKGATRYIGAPEYKKHGPSSIKLQDHGDPSPAISYRNIWVREL
ncbi:3-keto-disaccharide hydrolase [Pedobacter sp. KBS0701]|uniref:3-keto-disaccharide hydrolase n=1 Tax=unclassified Pedobacter TaxID=2628915 RepID=UPI00110E4D0B|nr:DUF1080 domain-containing protein [Pedobacter sp. KBS0701]QDW27666.1 DUF1080 domain-containing protein [Pedobacter sp. KBS0701]